MNHLGRILLVAGLGLILLGLLSSAPVDADVILADQSDQALISRAPVEPMPPVPMIPVATPVLDLKLPEKPPVQSIQNSPTPVTGSHTPFTVDDNINLFQFLRADRLVPAVQSNVPVRLEIPSINLDIQVLPATLRKVLYEGYVFDQWKPPRYAGGWQSDSAQLGNPGNTVINGHNNEFGEVFKDLEHVQIGDLVYAFSVDQKFTYIVTNKMFLLEAGESSRQRIENASWIAKSTDERLTLVTCWPYDNNTHRLIIVAKPVSVRGGN
ncbi:MAG TPA: sortase [Anaerolineaceae bacterium]|nr:sortase [Anaerolineaceae bacterium]